MFKTIGTTVESLLSVLSLLANTIVLISFVMCRLLRKRSSNISCHRRFVVCCRNNSDCHGCSVRISTQLVWTSAFGLYINVAATSCCQQLTTSTSFVIGVERFVAARWPFKHAQYCSQYGVAKFVVILWLITAGLFIYQFSAGIWVGLTTVNVHIIIFPVVTSLSSRNGGDVRLHCIHCRNDVTNC